MSPFTACGLWYYPWNFWLYRIISCAMKNLSSLTVCFLPATSPFQFLVIHTSMYIIASSPEPNNPYIANAFLWMPGPWPLGILWCQKVYSDRISRASALLAVHPPVVNNLILDSEMPANQAWIHGLQSGRLIISQHEGKLPNWVTTLKSIAKSTAPFRITIVTKDSGPTGRVKWIQW